MNSAAVAYVGIGSNLGDPDAQVRAGIAALDRIAQTRVARISRRYRCVPWGDAEQPEFVNAAAQIETRLDAPALMQALLGIEHAAGRDRVAGRRWGPRLIDLDLLLYGDSEIDQPGLRVPHPHLHERAFVLLPLADIAPGIVVPGRGALADLIAMVDASTCRVIESD